MDTSSNNELSLLEVITISKAEIKKNRKIHEGKHTESVMKFLGMKS